MRTETKPCPFCCNSTTEEYDTGGACCFCDYEGEVTVGKFGVFKDIEQYNKVYFASNHQDRLDELHGRNDNSHLSELIVDTSLVENGVSIWFDMKQVSNILQLQIKNKLVGRNEIFKLLRQKRILQEGNNLPYKKFVDLGYFDIKTSVVERVGQYNRETQKTLVSSTGIEFIKITLTQ
jgi:phage antirepressor YoqD-like protein